MFGIGKKRQTEPQEEFSQFDSGGFRLPVDDREALNIVEEKRKKRRAAPEGPKAQEEPKKSFLKFSLGRKKQPAQDKPKKVRKAKGPKPQGTGKKKLSKYYRRVLSVGVLLSAVIFGVSFGGRSFLNFLDSSVASNKIPETSQNLNARVDQLKKKYEQFNFDSFRLLIDSENKSKPQTDEEKSMWRDSLVTLFGDRYISLMEEQAQTAGALGDSGGIEGGAITATIPNYQVTGISEAGGRKLVTLIGPLGTEYWAFDKSGKSKDAPEGLVAYGLDETGASNDGGLPGFKVGVQGYEDEHYVFVPISGVSSQKVVSDLKETKRRQSYVSVKTPGGGEKMVAITGGPSRGVSGTDIKIDTQQAPMEMPQISPDGTVTIRKPDGSVEQVVLPPEAMPHIQGIQRGIENRQAIDNVQM